MIYAGFMWRTSSGLKVTFQTVNSSLTSITENKIWTLANSNFHKFGFWDFENSQLLQMTERTSGRYLDNFSLTKKSKKSLWNEIKRIDFLNKYFLANECVFILTHNTTFKWN